MQANLVNFALGAKTVCFKKLKQTTFFSHQITVIYNILGYIILTFPGFNFKPFDTHYNIIAVGAPAENYLNR